MSGRISRSRTVSSSSTLGVAPIRDAPDALQDHAGDHRIEQRLAAPDRLQRAHELGGPRLLENVAARSGNDGGEYVGFVGRTCQEDDLSGRELVPHQSAGLDPRCVRQADIHQDEIREEPPRLRDSLRARAGLGDHLELAVAIEEGDEPPAHDLVVIDDEKAEGSVGIGHREISMRAPTHQPQSRASACRPPRSSLTLGRSRAHYPAL